MTRLVISGASGFLASHVMRAAINADIDVLAIVSSGTAVTQDLAGSVDEVSLDIFLEGGYRLRSDDIFVNCLFPTNADGYWMADGLEKVFNIICTARRGEAGAFINISSQSVYDPHRKQPAREVDPLCLSTPYAVGKFASEAYCNVVFGDVSHTNLRLSSLVGVGYDQRIVNRLIDFALKRGNIDVVGGMQRYGLLDVRDAAKGIVALALSDPSTWATIYNLGRQESYTLQGVAELVASLVESEIGRPVAIVTTAGDDIRNSSIDSSLFMSSFGWEPSYELEVTVKDILHSKACHAETVQS